jgi:phytanoyl-CoA hydroxylase
MDSQYYPAAATPEAEVLSIWIPVQHVSAHNSCLECAPAVSGALPGWDDPVTKFRGISPADQAALRLRHTGVVCPLELGDVLCLNQMVPHRALPNCSDAVRWSLDVRYERRCADACEHAFTDKSGSPPLGFPLPRDGGAPIVGCHEWLSRWKDMPPGSY